MFNRYSDTCHVSALIGKTFKNIEKTEDTLTFWTDAKVGSYSLYHNQDCCEHVYLDDVIGDLSDLENTPILSAEEVSSSNIPPKTDYHESHTWTFYKFSTIKGSVTLRWYGTSNGYYSEKVTCGLYCPEHENES